MAKANRSTVVGCCAVLTPLLRRIQRHVFAAERLHSDDTAVLVLAKGKADTGRRWVYLRDNDLTVWRAGAAAGDVLLAPRPAR